MSLTEANLEKKLQAATNSQDSIQTLSLWLLHHRAHHQKIVAAWMKVLKKAKISHRLTLFYLANDVIQNSKRKGISLFKDSFAGVLRDATLLVRDEQIRNSVNRVFNIWGERNVYDSGFIDDLQGILANAKVPASAPSKLLAEFKCERAVEKLRSVAKLEMETTSKMATINISKLDATNAEIVQKLKDRTHGQQFTSEFDESSRCLEDLVKLLTKEVEEQHELILILEQSEIYYDTQRGEAKIVANAYKNFTGRVKTLQKRLVEVSSNFPMPSPVPSPCPDAPSPTTSDLEAELELPTEDTQNESSEKAKEDQKLDVSTKSESSIALMTSSTATTTNSIGKPIPILSSFFNQGGGKMTSWLDSFSPKKPGTSETKTNDSGSLDSRLSSLLQKIPNLPGSLQDTLLNTVSASENARNSSVPHGSKTVPSGSLSSVDATTPAKDEYSGQNTPLQDEDTLAPSGTSSFFSRLAAAPKASQSPKDILKGLTNLIQTASSKEKPFKLQDQPVTWHADKEPHIDKVCSFFNKLIPNQTSQASSLSPPPFFSPTASSSDSRINESSLSTVVPLSQSSGSALHSQPSFTTQSAKASNIHENLSFIPTLVPSTPTPSGSHFKFESKNDLEEYDPSAQNFDMDLDLESGEEGSGNTPNSGVHSDSSPGKESQEELMESLSTPRQSTLITLVTDSPKLNTSESGLEKKESPLLMGDSFPSVPPMGQEDNWPPITVPSTSPTDKPKAMGSEAGSDTPEVEPFFISAAPPILPEQINYPNGKERAFPGDWPHSKIETVQSLRTPNDNKWFGNDWGEIDKDYRQGFSGQGRPNQRFQGYPVYHQKSYHPTFEAQRHMWGQREHPYAGQNHGPQHKRFSPFTSRGRSWNRYPHPY